MSSRGHQAVAVYLCADQAECEDLSMKSAASATRYLTKELCFSAHYSHILSPLSMYHDCVKEKASRR